MPSLIEEVTDSYRNEGLATRLIARRGGAKLLSQVLLSISLANLYCGYSTIA